MSRFHIEFYTQIRSQQSPIDSIGAQRDTLSKCKRVHTSLALEYLSPADLREKHRN